MKHTTHISDTSIDSAGLPKDYKQALAELIWNGFDAKATEVHIQFTSNAIDSISKLTLSDNGEGIDHDSLKDTFGAFLDSQKKHIRQRSSYTRGRKGKGRFSFSVFAHSAQWHTVYKKEGKHLAYDISIKSNRKNEYEEDNLHSSRKRATGTDLILTDLHGVSAYSFSAEALQDFLAKEFGWFLFLNRKHRFAIKINEVPISYDYLIEENESRELRINFGDKEESFMLTYIRWKENIGDKYYYYFLNKERKEAAKLLSSHNNNAVAFHHSLYIESPFFDDFRLEEGDANTTLFGKNQNDPIFRKLMRELAVYLENQHRNFIRDTSAGHMLSYFETEGIFPAATENENAPQQKDQLADVVKELYCLQPRLFKGLKREQAQTMLGLLGLLLNSGQQENIVRVIENVVPLSEEEKQELTGVLQKAGQAAPKVQSPGKAGPSASMEAFIKA